MFSDESTLRVLDDRTQFVRRRPGEEYHRDCVVSTVKHPLSVMVWGAISVHGVSRLHIVQRMMRQDQYIEVLDRKLIPQLNEWAGGSMENLIFQQDNAPCHTSKRVKRFMQEKNIQLLDWPGNSADMNPIESLWKVLKDKMNESTITTKKNLIERLIHMWFHDDYFRQTARTLIERMPSRINAVIAARGGSTKY